MASSARVARSWRCTRARRARSSRRPTRSCWSTSSHPTTRFGAECRALKGRRGTGCSRYRVQLCACACRCQPRTWRPPWRSPPLLLPACPHRPQRRRVICPGVPAGLQCLCLCACVCGLPGRGRRRVCRAAHRRRGRVPPPGGCAPTCGLRPGASSAIGPLLGMAHMHVQQHASPPIRVPPGARLWVAPTRWLRGTTPCTMHPQPGCWAPAPTLRSQARVARGGAPPGGRAAAASRSAQRARRRARAP